MRKGSWMSVCLMLVAGAALAEEPAKPAHDMGAMKPAAKKKVMSDAAQIKLAMSAGPADIAKDATIVTMDDQMKMRELKKGTNGWMCMAVPEVMCADKEWQSFFDAYFSKKPPTVKGVGVAYMLKGDAGASNTDPFAMEKTADNNWIVSPAHIMILPTDPKQLDALPTDPNTGGPWVMWKGTPYAHIMVPTVPMPKPAAKK